ncbi:MAG TPA: flagellar biosynthesis protein FlgE [Rhodospirillaceae bacterium]|nr:flagellar biosynthesis protein FlgE [Rhodospirillaceae bacterium]
MGLFGSLFTGVSALFAQSQNTAIISNNIANISTTGFKRSEASFNSLVTSESRLSRFSPGTVSVNRLQRVDQQGGIQQTASSTDAAISGNGFFPIKRSTDFGQEFLYTRNGSFSEDAQGLLTNASGFVLYAWPIDSDGNLPANQGDLVSLVPADVAFLGGLTRPTTVAELAINLNANQNPIDPHALATAQQLPVNAQPAHFSRGLTVFDELGSAQTVTMNFRKVVGPMAHFATNATSVLELDDNLVSAFGPTPNINNGDTFTITVTGSPLETFEFRTTAGTAAPGNNEVVTVQDLIDEIQAYGGGGVLQARLKENGQLLVQAVDPSVTVTVTDPGGGLTGAGTLNVIRDPDPVPNLVYEPDASLSGPFLPTDPYPLQGQYPQYANIANPNTQGWWEMTVVHPDGSTITEGLINFNGDGTINAAADADGNVDIELLNIDWGNGASLQDFNIDISRFSQFAGNYDVIFSDQNGAELGLRTGIEITRNGTVVARFSNGASADLYKIPLITFANSNGLTEVSGTAYTEAEESGEENLREAGTGGAGFVEPSTLEASNVDLADEFAKLIVAQRAFGAGTRLINTVDQMTEDLLRLR